VTVVAFTVTQIPGIAGRRYPPALAGPRYPAGIPIVDESTLEMLCRREAVTEVVFAYSDVSHGHVMRVGSRVLAAGADFTLLGDRERRVAVLRHPMPYADHERQRSQRFATPADLDAAACTIGEREEYEPHLAAGNVVFAGVDYAEITASARRRTTCRSLSQSGPSVAPPHRRQRFRLRCIWLIARC
jgi:predicted GTPase